MMRAAVVADRVALETYLARHFETTMFMRGNLRDFGIGNRQAPYAMQYFLSLKNNTIDAVCAVANAGTVMGVANGDLTDLARFAKAALPQDFKCMGILAGQENAAQLRAIFDRDVPADFDQVEPLFSLELNTLIVPQEKGLFIRRAGEPDRDLITRWAYDYLLETGLRKASNSASDEAKEDADRCIASADFCLLVDGDTAVAQTGFNAAMPDCVQIGRVYTPPDLRRKGYARLAVALHLQQAQKQGVTKALLFSANNHASRAYMAIGFKQVGSYVLTLFPKPEG